MARLAVHPDVTATLFDNSVYGCETKPCSAAQALRRKKWLENSRLGLRIHSGPSVANDQHCVWTRLNRRMFGGIGFVEIDIRRFNRQRASIRHGVARIHDQIDNYLL